MDELEIGVRFFSIGPDVPSSGALIRCSRVQSDDADAWRSDYDAPMTGKSG